MERTASKIETGQFGEFAGAVVSQLWSVVKDKEQKELQRYIENTKILRNILIKAFEDKPPFVYDKTKDGWKLVEDTEYSEVIPVSNLEIISFLKEEENSISGEVSKQRAKELQANFGQKQAEYLLEHQGDIPKEWRNYYIVFPGTVWRPPIGGLDVPYLSWHGDCWSLRFAWFEDHWDSHYRLLRLRK